MAKKRAEHHAPPPNRRIPPDLRTLGESGAVIVDQVQQYHNHLKRIWKSGVRSPKGEARQQKKRGNGFI